MGVFIVNEALKSTTGLLVSPRLVVIKITPFAPRTPKTAVAEASFSTEKVSISSGSICE